MCLLVIVFWLSFIHNSFCSPFSTNIRSMQFFASFFHFTWHKHRRTHILFLMHKDLQHALPYGWLIYFVFVACRSFRCQSWNLMVELHKNTFFIQQMLMLWDIKIYWKQLLNEHTLFRRRHTHTHTRMSWALRLHVLQKPCSKCIILSLVKHRNQHYLRLCTVHITNALAATDSRRVSVVRMYDAFAFIRTTVHYLYTLFYSLLPPDAVRPRCLRRRIFIVVWHEHSFSEANK